MARPKIDGMNNDEFLMYARDRLRKMGYSIRFMDAAYRDKMKRFANHGKQWTITDHNALLLMFGNRETVWEMSKVLKRTVVSIIARLFDRKLIHYKVKTYYRSDDGSVIGTYAQIKDFDNGKTTELENNLST